MRRSYDFRAWSIKEEKFIYHIQLCTKNPSDTFMCYRCFGDYLIDSDYVVEEDTGVIDQNGNHIFEGDMVSGIVMETFRFTGKIIRKSNYFAIELRNGKILTKLKSYGLSVIGNIHEKEKLRQQRKRHLAPKKAIKNDK